MGIGSGVILQSYELGHELQLSQRDLADLTGLRQPAISRLESGNGNVTLDTLSKVAKALGMQITLTKTVAIAGNP